LFSYFDHARLKDIISMVLIIIVCLSAAAVNRDEITLNQPETNESKSLTLFILISVYFSYECFSFVLHLYIEMSAIKMFKGRLSK